MLEIFFFGILGPEMTDNSLPILGFDVCFH
jgi:hypothetical protein